MSFCQLLGGTNMEKNLEQRKIAEQLERLFLVKENMGVIKNYGCIQEQHCWRIYLHPQAWNLLVLPEVLQITRPFRISANYYAAYRKVVLWIVWNHRVGPHDGRITTLDYRPIKKKRL